MTIIEQIKAEVNRLKEHTAKCGYSGQDEYADGNKEGRNFICDKLLSFLSDLEKSEKPINPVGEELEEEFAIYLNRHFLNRVKYDESIDGFTTFDAGDMAKYFYDLGCRRTAEKADEIEYNRQRAEESVPKDLEEAAKEYAKTSFTRPFSDTPKEVITIIEPDKYAGFIAGAEWRDRMLNWARDLVQAGINKPEEAVNILKRLKELI